MCETYPPPLTTEILKYSICKKKTRITFLGSPKNSEPNPSSFRFLVGGTFGPLQVGPLLDEIVATCLGVPRNVSLYCPIYESIRLFLALLIKAGRLVVHFAQMVSFTSHLPL